MKEENENGRRGRSEAGRAEGAQTFRRGRALHFLERLELRRDTLAAQLKESAFDTIRPVIAGELKAVDAIIQEFIQVFELNGKPEGCERGRTGAMRHGDDRRAEKEGQVAQPSSSEQDGQVSAEQEESERWED